MKQGLIAATHLLASDSNVLSDIDLSALVSWVLRVMKISSGSELITVLDLLSFNLHQFNTVSLLIEIAALHHNSNCCHL